MFICLPVRPPIYSSIQPAFFVEDLVSTGTVPHGETDMGKAVPQLSFLLSSQAQVHFVRTCNKSENKVCLSSETKFPSSMTCPKSHSRSRAGAPTRTFNQYPLDGSMFSTATKMPLAHGEM